MVELVIENIGPIRNGTISLSPLTVIIGPNNSGKSVLAMATYAATHARQSAGGLTTFRGPRGQVIQVAFDPTTPQNEPPSKSLASACVDWVVSSLRADRTITARAIPSDVRDHFEREVLRGLEQFGNNLALELERCFGATLSSLIRLGQEAAGAAVEVRSRRRWRVRLEIVKRTHRVHVPSTPSIGVLLEVVRQRHRSYYSRVVSRETNPSDSWLLRQTYGFLLDACFADFPSESHYLPAARSGILQSHRALASFVMSRAPLAGIQDMQIPRMTGVLTDFISQLLDMQPRRSGPFHKIAADLEEELLHGGITIRTMPNNYPEISYRSGGVRYPLHRTSSMVSEIAPVALYLRNVLDPQELLIIEEPESHLHPRSQVQLAHALARLVGSQLRVMLTTHSDYFLSAINNSILAGTAGRSPAVNLPDALADVTLSESDVGAYLLQVGQGGTRVRALQVSPREGIAEDEFASVAENLYRDTVALDESLA